MTENQELLKIAHRFVTDREFRNRLMVAPRETLATDLGISKENYDALVAIVPALIAGGLFVVASTGSPQPSGPIVNSPGGWGGWGGR